MIKKVLSIDLDFILKPIIQLYNDMVKKEPYQLLWSKIEEERCIQDFLKYDEDRFRDSLIFNESEYFYLYNNPYSWNISKQLHDFKFNECIFIGISLTDPNMKRLLELASNYFKFNFIFMKREKGFSEKTFIDVTNYFFTYDLITIWIDEYEEIGSYLEMI